MSSGRVHHSFTRSPPTERLSGQIEALRNTDHTLFEQPDLALCDILTERPMGLRRRWSPGPLATGSSRRCGSDPVVARCLGRLCDSAGDVGILIDVVAGADPVIAVGDGERLCRDQPCPAPAESAIGDLHGETFSRSTTTWGLSGGRRPSRLARKRSFAFRWVMGAS